MSHHQQQYGGAGGNGPRGGYQQQHQYHGHAPSSSQGESGFAQLYHPTSGVNSQWQQQQQQQGQVEGGVAPGGVEWYSGGSGGTGGSGGLDHQGGGARGGVSRYNPAEYASYSQAPEASGGAYGTFEEDPPLLEELGIDVPAILHRVRSILTFRFHASDVDNLDLGGPLICMAILAVAHLLVGKLHFGYILGWTVVGSALLWYVLSSVASGEDDQETTMRLDLYASCSIVGYSLIPLVLHALISLMFPRRSTVTLVMGVVAVLWAAVTAAKLFILRSGHGLRGQLSVVVYPCVLMYTAFALLTLY